MQHPAAKVPCPPEALQRISGENFGGVDGFIEEIRECQLSEGGDILKKKFWKLQTRLFHTLRLFGMTTDMFDIICGVPTLDMSLSL